MAETSDKSFFVTLILCVFVGIFGAHRFYVGKKKTAFIQLFTLGGLLLWSLSDFFLIAFGYFKDAKGLYVR